MSPAVCSLLTCDCIEHNITFERPIEIENFIQSIRGVMEVERVKTPIKHFIVIYNKIEIFCFFNNTTIKINC